MAYKRAVTARRVVQGYRRLSDGPGPDNPYNNVDAGARAIERRQAEAPDFDERLVFPAPPAGDASEIAPPPRLTASPTIRPEEMGPGQSPGAIFDTMDDAARAGLEAINPWSIAENREYRFPIYRGANGKYGFLKPEPGGSKGGRALKLRIPPNTVAMAHTHGDYMDLDERRTTKARDAFNSDDFSNSLERPDEADYPFMRRNERRFLAYYLGTPSGAFYAWDPQTRKRRQL